MVAHGKWSFHCSCCLSLPLFLFVTVTRTVSVSVNFSNARFPVATNSSQPQYVGIDVNDRSALCPKEILQNATNNTNSTSSDDNAVLCVEEKIYDQTKMNRNVSKTSISQTTNAADEYICESRDRPCIPLCCPPNSRVTKDKCLKTNSTDFPFPSIYHAENLTLSSVQVNRNSFHLFVRDPCDGGQRYKLDPDEYEEDAFKLLGNGSVHRGEYEAPLDYTRYCLGVVDKDKYDVVLCFEQDNQLSDVNEVLEDPPEDVSVVFPIGLIISTPFLFATFLVYCIVPELRNMHGRTLRGYVGSLLVAYVVLAVLQIGPQHHISDSVCVTMAFIIHFSFLASFFWLNVMCFDIWWTFGGFRSLQGTIKQRDRKKFIIYSIYAWGCASVLTGVCIIMDFAPNIPPNFIKPQFGVNSCWFTTNAAKALYFYGPMGVTIFCNICLFISTALKIVHHKKDTAHHLKGSESRRHDDNKQWFNLYLKLFIVMGINWSMEIVSWVWKWPPQYVWYITDLANTLQGLIIFIIFVWKDKIKKLLLKRFGCRDRSILSRNSTRSVYHSSTSRTCTTSAAAPLQEKVNPYVQVNSYKQKATEETDCAA